MRPRPHQSDGFTLLELLVVLGVVGLVLAAVIAAKPKSVTTRLAVTARAVVATLQRAHTRAIVRNVETIYLVDVKSGTFGLERDMNHLPRGMTVVVTFAETERYRDSGGLRFYPNGQSSGGDVTLTLEGHHSLVTVNWLTGEAKLGR